MKATLIRSPVIIGMIFFACPGSSPQRFLSRTTAIQTFAQQEASPQDESENPDQEKMFSTFFVEDDALDYNGYQFVKLEKSVKYEELEKDIRITYGLLKKNERVFAEFDGVYFTLGNATEFGLAPFLGLNSKQLILSQTVPRGGRHWVVDLSSDAHVLFDSFDYSIGREEVCVFDIDEDGVSELGLELTTFWGFESLAMCQHEAMPLIVFKYDSNSRKYFPANPLFEYGLEGIDVDAAAIDPTERLRTQHTGEYLGKRLGVFLRYLYAGKRQEAWEFFNRTYKLGDAARIKSEITAKLRREPVYRFIYGLTN